MNGKIREFLLQESRQIKPGQFFSDEEPSLGLSIFVISLKQRLFKTLHEKLRRIEKIGKTHLKFPMVLRFKHFEKTQHF